MRGILARALDMYADLGDETFVFAQSGQLRVDSQARRLRRRVRPLRRTSRRAADRASQVAPKTDLAGVAADAAVARVDLAGFRARRCGRAATDASRRRTRTTPADLRRRGCDRAAARNAAAPAAASRVASQSEAIRGPFARAREREEQRTERLRRQQHRGVEARQEQRPFAQLLARRRVTCGVGGEEERGREHLAERDECATYPCSRSGPSSCATTNSVSSSGKAVDERIAEHDAVRASDAGDEGVGFARLPAHIHAQNLGVADAEARRERAQTLLERAVTGSNGLKSGRT